jgi:hypothetical protein
MSGVEDEVQQNFTRNIIVIVSVSSSHSGREVSSLKMANQDSTLRLPTFHGIGRDDAKQHWFTYEEIWFYEVDHR